MESTARLKAKNADRHIWSERPSNLRPYESKDELRRRGRLAILGDRRCDRPQRDRSPPEKPEPVCVQRT